MLTNNNRLSNNLQKSKELLSFLLKKTLDNRLSILEEKNNKENKNLLSMKEISNNMLSFLKDTSQKLATKSLMNNNCLNNINNENTIIRKFTKTFTNKNKDHMQSRTPLETTPIKTKKINSKEKLFDNKIKKKKKMTVTPADRSPNDNLQITRKASKLYKKNIINTNNKPEINYKKKKPLPHLKRNNTTLFLSKQNCVINIENNNNNINNNNRNKLIHHYYSHTVSPLKVKNKKAKKSQIKSHRKNFSVHSKKKNNRNINNNEKEFKSSKMNNSFFKPNKDDTKNENKFNIINMSNIKQKLDSLCDNNLFDNDIKLNELKIDDLQQSKNIISSPIYITEDKTVSSLNQSLLKLSNEDDSICMDNYLCNIGPYERNNFDKKISFEECLESCIEYIYGFLSIKDLFSLGLINKEFFKIIIQKIKKQ